MYNVHTLTNTLDYVQTLAFTSDYVLTLTYTLDYVQVVWIHGRSLQDGQLCVQGRRTGQYTHRSYGTKHKRNVAIFFYIFIH